jgi:tetratricopeptide (TPR) repeat protein
MTTNEAFQIAMAQHRAGQLAEAEKMYRQILAVDPNHVDSIHLLGVLAAQAGHRQAAVDLLSRAVALRPEMQEYHSNLGTALLELKQVEKGIAEFELALALRPNQPQVHNNLGNALSTLGKHEEGITHIQRAVSLDPNYAQAYFNLANIQKILRRWDEAIQNYHRALKLQPGYREAENNLGYTLCSQGNFAEAEKIFEQALVSRPSDPLAHWNVALMLLRRGDLERGLREYESRWAIPELQLKKLPGPGPEWDGADLNGKRILIYAEQGLGDSIQFARYFPQVAARGGKVIVNCQKELRELLKDITGIAQCYAHPGGKDSKWDVHCSLPSLPRLMGTTLANIPATVPYLKADPTKADAWRKRLQGEPRKKIGLVWAGSKRHPSDAERSIRPEEFAPLFKIDARFISLQKGDADGRTASSRLKIDDWTDELNDFTDTAALIENLDLVVTVDTAVAHLAGAMGKPVWVLLAFVPDWRWMMDRSDSPWYPTMRLFRQERCGEWNVPIAGIARELELLCRE